MAKQASDTLDLVRSRRLVFTATITKMFSKMTKGQLTALAAILKMSTARSSGESLSAIARGRYGTEPQLADVVLIVVLFMFSGLIQNVFRFLELLQQWGEAVRVCGQFESSFVCVSNKFNLRLFYRLEFTSGWQ